MPAPEPELRAVFCEVLERETALEQAHYLDQACQGRPALRQRVEALLRAHRESHDFLQEASSAVVGAETPDPLGVAPAPSHSEFASSCRDRAVSRFAEGPGTILGPYKLLELIGEGAFGLVFLAEQQQPIRRKVAVKVLKPGMDTRRVIGRFEAERQALALMDHPHIARVLDAGETPGGRPYFAMELVRGVPFTDYCDHDQLATRQRLELFVTVCQAVQHAHQKGIIHRDLKPTNILVTLHDDKPVAKVIDFGIAKALGQQLTDATLHTGFAQLIGTPLYMSPEQAHMSALDIDTRSDIYSLGVLLYELLTGTTPFDKKRLREAGYDEIRRIIREEDPAKPSLRLSSMGETATVVSARRQSDPKRLERLYWGELDWIVMKALEKDRTRRYESAAALAADIQRYLSDEAVLACPPTAWYRFRKLARRNRATLTIAAVTGAALIVIAVGSLFSALYLHSTLKESESNRSRAEDAEKAATERLYGSLVAQARATRRRMGQRFAGLDALTEAAKLARDQGRPPEKLLELRNQVIACLALPDMRVSREWDGNPAASHIGVDFDDKLERYVRVDPEGRVSVRRVADDSKICDWQVWPGESGAEFSRDGRFVLVSRLGRVQVWDITRPEPVSVLSESTRMSHAFSPDSRWFALSLQDGTICLYELPSWQRRSRFAAESRVIQLAFAPEGRRLAMASAAGVQIRDWESGKPLQELPCPRPSEIAWHPDGKMVAAVGADLDIYLWDVADGQQSGRLQGARNGGIRCAFNHTGDLLVSTGWDGMVRLWDWRARQQLIATYSGFTGTPRFSPDDRLMAVDVEGTKLRLWDTSGGGEYRTLVRNSAPGVDTPEAVAVRPDGRLLVVATNLGLSFWNLDTCRAAGYAPLKRRTSFAHFESEHSLLTYGEDGFFRRPIEAGPGTPVTVKIGTPEKLPLPGAYARAALSADCRVVAICQSTGALVVDRSHPDEPVQLRHADTRVIAVSPNGQWVATGGYSHPGGAKIWEVATHKLKKDLPVGLLCRVAFSPDGAWLATTGGGRPRLWSTASWTEGPTIPWSGTHIGALAFSPNSRMLAVETGTGAVRLIDRDGGALAEFEDPNQDRADEVAFSPGGDRLITASRDSNSTHVWDLTAIRQKLAEMGLDWK